MSVNKINPVYNPSNKQTGDPVSAEEWNSLTTAITTAQNKVNEIIDNPSSSSEGTSTTPVDTSGILSVSSKGNVTVSSNKNINIEPAWKNTTPYTGNQGDIALKPGDDIQFCSHHRDFKKRDKIVVKNIDGADNPVKLEVVAGEIDLTVGTESNPKTATRKKDKNTGADTADPLFKSSDAKVLDVRVLTGVTLQPNTAAEREERGYLKVRAQAIDLRCEKHGGIALQPKGYDGDGNMNKIKFEHGGGDGLEFGTFNTEKTSIFTDEYRFNKNGIWKMATRQTEPNTKTIYDDNAPAGKPETAALKYVKQEDDFYDIIDATDKQCTTKDIIETASALNGSQYARTHITDGGNLEIETRNKVNAIKEFKEGASATTAEPLPETSIDVANVNTWYEDTVNGVSGASRIIAEEPPKIQLETDNTIELTAMNACVWDDVNLTAEDFIHVNPNELGEGLKKDTDPETKYVDGKIYGITDDDRKKSDIDITQFDEHLRYVKCRQIGESGGITLESDAKIKLSAPKVTLEGVTGFGSTMTFGETDEGIRYQYKATKKGKNKQCDVLQVKVYNNSSAAITFNEESHLASNSDKFVDANGDAVDANSRIPTFYKTGNVSVPAGSSVVVAQCSIMDIIKLVSYMKYNNEGPWAAQL